MTNAQVVKCCVLNVFELTQCPHHSGANSCCQWDQNVRQMSVGAKKIKFN